MMAAKGCRIVLACRSKAKALEAIASVKKDIPDADVHFMALDLADWDSVKKFAAEFKQKDWPIHILMNNAGIMAPYDCEMSKFGIEMQMAGNHLGHFYLTSLLVPVIRDTAATAGNVRIVNLSSAAHQLTYGGGIDFENINNPAKYTSFLSYGQSKLANILFSNHLQRLLESQGQHNVFVNSVHPGGVNTNLATKTAYLSSVHFLLEPILRYVILSPETGALTQVYAATSDDVVKKGYKAKYFVPVATLDRTSTHGEDAMLAEKLWDWSMETLKSKGFTCSW
ncbi:hypothetical protein BC830DRAFT_1159537 [Chytriomyces sp. MP71]|nr:hypothetical protein BC830DRAFT_1159537 [Chytriomyces sp. MP71]